MNIWTELRAKAKAQNRTLCVLAPMADVTDIAFRTLISECGNPDMMWTEFVSADGLVRATPEGKKKLLADLLYTDIERPIVAQLFGSNPENMEAASYLVASLGFDGIDINMGCPDKSIEKQGAGAGMIKNPKRAQEIILAAKAGAKRWADEKSDKRAENSTDEKNSEPTLVDNSGEKKDTAKTIKFEPIPVSVKTRIGYNKNELDTWLPALLETYPALITVHARTRKEMSLVPARWEHVAEAVLIRDRLQSHMEVEERTLIFGNGDVLDVADGMKKCAEAGADGAMLGRALFGNPWLFSSLKDASQVSAKESFGAQENLTVATGSIHNFENYPERFPAYQPTVEEKLRMTIFHTELFEKYLGDIKNFAIMKKHFKAYINGFDGAKELRGELMEKAEQASDVKGIIERYLDNNKI